MSDFVLLILQVFVPLSLLALVVLLGLYTTAAWVTYIEFLCSEECAVWWRHPPGSGYDHLHSIRRFHRVAVSRTGAWLRLRRWTGEERGRS